MVDVHTTEQRRVNMRAIRHKDTNPELQIRRLLFAKGLRFRLHVKNLPGKPDIVLHKHRVAIFVHGCFWHGHDCPLFKMPATRTEFWMRKIQSNRDRDIRDATRLLAEGWRVLTVWECAIKGKAKWPMDDAIAMMVKWILDADAEVQQLNIRHQ